MNPQVNTEEEQTSAEGPGPSSDPGPDPGPLVLKLKPELGSIVAGGDGKPGASAGADSAIKSSAVTSSATKGSSSSGFRSISVSATKCGSAMEGSTVPLPVAVAVEVPCSIVSSSGGASTSASISSTISQSIQPTPPPMPTLRFVLRHRLSPTADPDTNRRVRFHESVVDNEKLNRRKSKCCCIYRKPHPFGESSSETDDECEHCFGHPEVRTKNRLERKGGCGCGCCGGHSHAHAHAHADVVPEEVTNAQPVEPVVPVISEGSGDQQQEGAPEDSVKTKTAAQKTDDDQDDVLQSWQSS